MSEHAKVHHKLERSRLERSREEAINLMMRQQIQPHFLFNALATLKTLIVKDPGMAQNYLVQLSDFLRITIASVKNGELASIDQEIKLCEDYLNMQKIRFGEALHYQVDVSLDVREKQLPIFSIQPLVDNVLKHNSFTVQNPVRICVDERDGWIVVRNNKNIQYQKVESNGSGLRNLVERYKYLFVQGVEIDESNDFFEVRIRIL
ncbi:Histidine kinase [Sphingobacterium nematocida]|uniref:Histidine kinase n=1 Tax=Sphingobacterium nematocida TaxID=1513896 RepID=A0A1T5CKY9_9SPHI|nr:histidine kinase [Sphingobacterium nematocida]SKB60109.1 Histidine kinase [Sphingobacterium nematocida]